MAEPVRKPALGYVVHSLDPGGTERLVVDMSVAFADAFDVKVLCLDEPGLWAETLRRQGISVSCAWRQPGFDIATAWRIAAFARRHDIRLLHAHQCTPWFYAALSRLFCRKPRLLLEEHGRFHPEQDSRLRRFVNRAVVARLTHHAVAVSRDIRERLVRYEGLDRDAIDVVYNGLRVPPPLPEQDRRRLRTSLGYTDADFIVGTIGRFDRIKNLPMFVRSVVAARRGNDKVRGLIVGDGPEFGSIVRLVEAANAADTIVLTGFRDDARDLVQCLDLFTLCSFSEGTSMALLEAMACSVPVAVTGVGGNPEIVEDGATGWVVASDDADAMARVIVDASRDPAATAALGKAGHERFAKDFTFSTMIENYRRIYATLLAAAAPAGAAAPD